ncbi:MAG: hypothetical protein JSS14_20820 [Proteobacteria bacterium]|nr:hypothetical protein [Pseudomonadota bacterium]
MITAHAAWVCCGLAFQALAWGEEAVGPPAAAQALAAPTTKLRFERGYAKPGIESLRVVRREQTMHNVAGQVALNVIMLVLGGEPRDQRLERSAGQRGHQDLQRTRSAVARRSAPRRLHARRDREGNDELSRLRFGAELGHAGLMRSLQACGYQAEPIA